MGEEDADPETSDRALALRIHASEAQMLMIDIIRLPGVNDARNRLLCNGPVHTIDVDELIMAVAEGVEKKIENDAQEAEDLLLEDTI